MQWGAAGRRPALILAGVAFIDSVERGILPGVLSDAQDSLGFSDFEGGLLGSAVIIAGLIMTIPAGYVADRMHRPRLIAGVLASWGLVAAVTATVQNWGQFMAARAALGVADTIDNPASSSLIADYYPSQTRSRVFGILRAAPIFGTAIGIGLGGLVASLAGWRWAFIVIGVPGSLFAIVVLTLPNPQRGAQEGVEVDAKPVFDEDVFRQIRTLLEIRSLRALALGAGIATGGVSGLGFWAPSFFERHAGLSPAAAAGIAGGLILLGAIVGTLLGSQLSDRLRATDPGGAMRQAGISQILAAVVMFVAFLNISPWLTTVPLMALGVPLIVNGLPGLSATTAEVVPPELRGMAFSVTAFVSTAIGATSAPLIGLVADQFDHVASDGAIEGNLAYAFQMTVPFLALGGFLGGWIFDLAGHYHIAFLVGVAFNVVNLMAIITLLRFKGPHAPAMAPA